MVGQQFAGFRADGRRKILGTMELPSFSLRRKFAELVHHRLKAIRRFALRCFMLV